MFVVAVDKSGDDRAVVCLDPSVGLRTEAEGAAVGGEVAAMEGEEMLAMFKAAVTSATALSPASFLSAIGSQMCAGCSTWLGDDESTDGSAAAASPSVP